MAQRIPSIIVVCALLLAVIVVVGLLAASLIKGSPRELGLVADGFATCETTVELPAPRGMGLSAAMGTKQFWSYFCAIFFGSVGLFLALIHINPYARQFGLSSSQANLLIGMIGVGNVAGRLLLGRLGDRVGARQLLISLTGALVLLNLFWLAAHTFETMVLFALLFGAANGGCISLYPSLASSWFGTRHLGAILGALYIAVGIAALIGGSVAGFLFDRYQNYEASILLGAARALLSVVFILIASHRPVQRAVSKAPRHQNLSER